ncbi:hypothetical protein JYT96_01925 [Gammaproteobacteria bacterium AH-315-C21]|nr:hypothetical protein [Gammaproteobacteria bacterium AH-315-C21]
MLKLFHVALASLLLTACSSTPTNLSKPYKLAFQAKYGQGKAIELEISENAEDKLAFIDGAKVGYIQSWNALTLERRLTLKKQIEIERNNESLKHNNELWRRYGSILETKKIARYLNKYSEPSIAATSYNSFEHGRSIGIDLAARDIIKIRQKEVE